MKGKYLTILLAIFATMMVTGCDDVLEEKHISKVPTSEAPATELARVPTQLNLDIDFYSQAPTGDWAEPYQNTCEEASLVLALNYVNGVEMNLDQFDQKLLDIVAWENEHFGYYKDTTIEETAEISRLYFGHDNVEVVKDPTIAQIKGFLTLGYPVIAPFAGQELGNPYFTGAGPVYHMLVIRGFENGRFITNDVGTRHGENFAYNNNVLMGSMHDWVEAAHYDDDAIFDGAKTVLVVKP
jgi:hypothetical protein